MSKIKYLKTYKVKTPVTPRLQWRVSETTTKKLYCCPRKLLSVFTLRENPLVSSVSFAGFKANFKS